MEKRIYDADGNYKSVSNINGYLLDAPNIFIDSRGESVCSVPRMILGNFLFDGGCLTIEEEDYDEFVARDPRSKKFIRRYMMAHEFLHNKPRYCLWLVDAEPSEIKSIKPIHERVKACKEFRLSRKSKTTQDAAKTPWLFKTLAPRFEGNFIAIPRVSSERRDYIPMGYLDSNTIVGDTLYMIPNGNLSLFGILMSRVHMAWTKVVCGRLEMRIRYSSNIVYNNFPFHKPTPHITITAKRILDARDNYPNSSLADLYDPDLMPKDLRRAHEENDRAVLDAYEFPRDISDNEIVARLFNIYAELTRLRKN